MHKLISKLHIVFKGFCMGIADIIPGVSGGTIAFLMGIYEELIDSLSSFDLDFVRRVFTGKFSEAFGNVGWKFLVQLLSGMLIAIFSLSHLMKWLLTNQSVYVHSFFFGLILMTVFVIAKKIRKGDFGKMAVGFLSAILMFKLVGLVPLQTPETWWFLFFSGAIAICAMILPGISGAFILLLLGKYEYVITAVSERDFGVLIIVALGCAVGLFSAVRVLRWLLHRHYDLTLSILTGLVLGSLRKMWPWKEVVRTIVSHRGKVIPVEEINVFPQVFSMEIIYVLMLCAAGIGLSLWLSRFDQEK